MILQQRGMKQALYQWVSKISAESRGGMRLRNLWFHSRLWTKMSSNGNRPFYPSPQGWTFLSCPTLVSFPLSPCPCPRLTPQISHARPSLLSQLVLYIFFLHAISWPPISWLSHYQFPSASSSFDLSLLLLPQVSWQVSVACFFHCPANLNPYFLLK